MTNKRPRWLWDKCGGHCAYCGIAFATPWDMSVDHLRPLARGGDNTQSNRFPCCRACNATKGPRSLEYLRDALQRRISGRPQFSEAQRVWLASAGFQFPSEDRFVFYWERMGNTFPETEA
jgi:hypothetical protein